MPRDLPAEPGPGLELMRDLARRRTATLLELAPLPAGAVAEMARECVHAQVLPPGLDGLMARAEGVPFLVEELLACRRRNRRVDPRRRRLGSPAAGRRRRAADPHRRCRAAGHNPRPGPPVSACGRSAPRPSHRCRPCRRTAGTEVYAEE